MKEKIIVGIVVGLVVGTLVPLLIYISGIVNDWWNKSEIPSGVIIMSNEDCSSLSGEWETYKNISGKFPIASGSWNDGFEKKSFSVGDTGGEYRHKLLRDEMPSHDHSYNTKSAVQPQAGKTTDVWVGSSTTLTGPAGNDMPHNNVPPYRVLNFCIKR